MAATARLSLWVPADRQGSCEAVYELHLDPILRRHGLVEPRPDDRPTVAGVCSLLFAVENAGQVVSTFHSLAHDPGWQAALLGAGSELGLPDPEPHLRYRFTPYDVAAGPGSTVAAGPGVGQGLWRSYGVRDGLPYSVTSILRDREGDLWLATGWPHAGGVTRFDGTRFTTYTAADGLAHDKVRAPLEDRHGHLWLATDGGVSRFDGERFVTYTAADGLAGDQALSLLEDREGRLWVGTSEGVGRYDGVQWLPLDTDGLADAAVGAMVEDRQGRLWFGTGSEHHRGAGVSRYDGERLATYTTADGLGDDTVLCLLADGQGHVWAGTKEGGASCFDGERFQPVGELATDGITGMAAGADGHLWLTTSRQGVRRFDGLRWNVYTQADGIGNDQVRCVTADPQGQVWFGTYTGVSRLDTAHFTNFTTHDGLVHNGVMSLLEDRHGRLWAGTWDGLSCFDGSRWTTIDELTGWSVHCSLEDRRGNLWFGDGHGEGLTRYDGEAFTRFTTADGLAHNGIKALLEDSHGRLWIGTQDGVSRYDGTALTSLVRPAGPNDGRILDILEDRHGSLWFATDNGVIRLREDDIARFGVAEGLPHERARDILEDRQGHLWFATDGGLSRYDGATFASLTAGQGLAHDIVMDILEDRQGHLWFATYGGGVSRYDGRVFQNLSHQDGLVSDTVQALLQDRHGDIWIATEGGLTRYRPGATPPTVQLQAVIADQRYEPGEGIRIPVSQKLVSFEFAARSWTTSPERVAYVCRLIGHEADWQPVGTGRVEYEGLPAGEYTFQVRAVDRDLNYSAAAEVALSVEPDMLLEALTVTLSESGPVGEFVGRSAALQDVLQQLEQVAPADLTVLISGETGTGKGLAARALHELSPRNGAPFVQVNCGAIPEALIEAELFGHEKGAFTGAVSRRLGKIELAAGGTLFLDEIGDMPLEAQVKLLRVLEERTFERVGGSRVLRADVRVVAATNRDLRRMIGEGSFREDLFFRLQGFDVRLPPLRERREDIPLLALYFIGPKAAHLAKAVSGLSRAAEVALVAHAWPGNVRELQHAIERAVVVCRGETIELGDLSLGEATRAAPNAEMLTLEDVERRHIVAVLEDTGWRVSGARGAATVLGLKESTLRFRMKKLGIARP